MSKITVEQLGELIAQAKDDRVTRENLQAYLRNPNGFIAGGQAGVYPVVIDYGKSVAEMIVAGRYDWKNDDINDTNFKVCGGTGVVTVALELVHLNKVVNSEDVLRHLEENGMRPANLAELLVFGATFPEIQREFPVICLDKASSWVDPHGYRYVPYLLRGGSGRELYLYWFDDDWYEHCRFLAVRKSA